MLSPRGSLALKTLLVVFIATLCLWLGRPMSRDWRQNPRRTTNSPAASQTVVSSRVSQPTNSVPAEPAEVADLAQFTLATLWGREHGSALAAFSKWAGRYTNATPAEQSAMLPEGIALAHKRREAFKDLIRTEPKLALAETVPALVRNQLPTSIQSLLEERVTGQGDFLVLGRSDAANDQAISRRAIINAREYEAFVYGARISQQSRSNISLHGVALDGQLALSDSPLRVFESGEPVPVDKPLAAESCPISRQPTAPTKNGPRPNAVAAESGTKVYWMCHGKHVAAAAGQVAAEELQFPFAAYANDGFRSALIMIVDFSDKPGAANSNASIDDTITAVDQFFNQNSFGDLHLTSHTITPLLRMPRTSRAYADGSNPSGDSLLLSDARAAARTAGFNPDNFDFDMVAFADIGFQWSGQGYVGSKGAWIQGNFSGSTVGHELGHNLGLWHANSWDSSESSISPNGSHQEYGNPFDVMGRSATGFPNTHYSANFKHLLGWLSAENITVVNGSGTYRLYAHDQNSRVVGRSYALNIPVGIVAGDEVEDYWIDFRQLMAAAYPATDAGAIVQWGNDSGTQSASRLLDMNYTTSTKADSPLALGRTFNDPDRGLQIKPLLKSGIGSDAYLDVQITLVAPPIVDLGEAVDNTNFVWSTSTAPWIGQRSVTHDGVDSAASAPIRDSSETYMETTIDGPGALFFWWKVSSEQNFDFLTFLIDGQEVASISGQVDWQQRGYELAAGSHTVRWLYKKDGGSAGGADRGWVDEVTFVTGEHAPFINTQPQPVTAGIGETAEITIDAVGSAPLTYQWQKISDTGDPVAIPGATNATLTITNVQDSDGGLYNCVVSNSSGSITSGNAVLTIVRLVSLSDAVDNTDADWSASGAIPWSGQQVITHDGIDAAASGAIPDGKDSSLNATIIGPGTLTFWWKVSSEVDYDILSLYMDGNRVEYHSGEMDWTNAVITIPNGTHKLRWTYSKDANLSEGMDAAWVDEVRFTPITNVAPRFITPPGPQAVSIGGTALFTAQYTAAQPATFGWFKNGVPVQNGPTVTGADTDTLCITNVQSSDAGIYTLQIANAFGSVANSGSQLSIVQISLADALDQPTRAFLTGGSANWSAQTSITHDLADAARSGIISDDQFTWIETRVSGPANVSFWWKASSEQDYDFLMFELDTIGILKISGTADWRHETVPLTSGDHILRWKYQKDRNTGAGDDAGWVDQLDIVPITPPQPEITNVKIDANGVSAVVQTLPASGDLILECSTNLANWTPLSTNQINGVTLTIDHPATNNVQFLRVRVQ